MLRGEAIVGAQQYVTHKKLTRCGEIEFRCWESTDARNVKVGSNGKAKTSVKGLQTIKRMYIAPR